MELEVLDGLERKLNFVIDKNAVQNVVSQKLKMRAKTAKAPGFRPGKVPANVVEKLYGMELFEESLSEKLRQDFFKFIEDNNIKLAGVPDFDLSKAEENELSFVAKFEVLPEFILPEWSTLNVSKPICTLTDENLEKTIDTLRKQRVTYFDAPEDAIVVDGDRVVINFVGTVDGVEFAGGKADNYPFTVGAKQMLPDFENGVLGMKVGETKTVVVNFPDNYHATELKGKNAEFVITLNKISKSQLPELDQEFVKSVGVEDGSIESLRAEVKKNLEHEVERRLAVKLRANVLDGLDAWMSFDLPKSIVHDEIHVLMDDYKSRSTKNGYDVSKLELSHDQFSEPAKRIVKLRLIIQRIVQDNQIKITDQDVTNVIKMVAYMYEDEQQYLEWFYKDEKRVEEARNTALEKKVIDFVVSKASLTDVAISYEDLISATM